MASWPPHHSGAPYYGPPPGHGVYREPRQSRTCALRPDIPSYYPDVIPVYFVSSPAPSMAPRDMRPNTGRVRRPRPSTSQNRQMHHVSTVQGASTSKYTASHRRSPSQLWFVPDPPTWSSPTAQRQTRKPEIDKIVNSLPQIPLIDERHRTVESHRTQVPLASPLGYGGKSSAALDQGLPSPPPTPRIPRLRTPDIKPMDDCKPFCDCCAEVEREIDSRWRMELQCQVALEHIKASRLRAEGASEEDSQTPLLAEEKRVGGKKVRFEE